MGSVSAAKQLDGLNGGKLIQTLNKMGYMCTGPWDEYTEAFIESSATADGPVADLGCAYGYSTKQMLDAGAKSVIANDLAREHLEMFAETLTGEEKKRVTLAPGDAGQVCSELKPASLAGIFASYWLHFIHGERIRELFGIFYRALKPGGILVIVTASPIGGIVRDHMVSIEERKRAGEEWPGWIESTKIGVISKDIPDHMMFIEPDQLEREAKMAGFLVRKASYFRLRGFPESFLLDGREGSGIIAEKP